MPPPPINTFLETLPARTQTALRARLRPITLKHRQVLLEPGELFQDVYFPLSAVICLFSVVDGDRMVEGTTIGNEGFVGVPAFLGHPYAISRVMCQLPGECLAIGVKVFRHLISEGGRAASIFAAYTDFLLASTFRNIACMQYHDLGARCARWLLVTQDRTSSHNLPYTQTLLAETLGVTRPRVTTIALALQRDGLIQYRRGLVTLIDRKGLEKRACSCYAYVNRLRTERLGIHRGERTGKRGGKGRS